LEELARERGSNAIQSFALTRLTTTMTTGIKDRTTGAKRRFITSSTLLLSDLVVICFLNGVIATHDQESCIHHAAIGSGHWHFEREISGKITIDAWNGNMPPLVVAGVRDGKATYDCQGEASRNPESCAHPCRLDAVRSLRRTEACLKDSVLHLHLNQTAFYRKLVASR
jgi:hypothetical protein